MARAATMGHGSGAFVRQRQQAVQCARKMAPQPAPAMPEPSRKPNVHAVLAASSKLHPTSPKAYRPRRSTAEAGWSPIELWAPQDARLHWPKSPPCMSPTPATRDGRRVSAPWRADQCQPRPEAVTQCTVGASACKTHDELKLQRPHAVLPADDAFDDDLEASKHFFDWLPHLYMHDCAVHCQRKRLACRDCVAAKQFIQNACHLFLVLTHHFQNPGIGRSQLCSGIQERAASKVGLTEPAPESTK